MISLGFLSCVVVIESRNKLGEIPKLHKLIENFAKNFELIICVPSDVFDKDLLEKITAHQGNLAVYEISAKDRDTLLTAGLELALGDWILQVGNGQIHDVEILLSEFEKVNPGQNQYLQLINCKARRVDKIFSKLASKILESEVRTLFPTSRLMPRSTLYSWNNRKLRNKVIRIAPNLESAMGVYIRGAKFSKHETKRYFRIALRTIVYSSAKPLRLISIASWGGATLALLASLVVFFIGLYSNVVPGWTTTNLQIGIMSFLTLTVLGFLSEYIYQITATTIAQPSYSVRREQLSNEFRFKINNNIESQDSK